MNTPIPFTYSLNTDAPEREDDRICMLAYKLTPDGWRVIPPGKE